MPDYFTLAELRALPDMGDAVKYTNARCEAAAAYIVGIIEREVGTSFVHRTIEDEAHDGGGVAVFLNKPYVRSITGAKVNGVALADTLVPAQGAAYRVVGGSPVAFPAGFQALTVTYVAGYTAEPPPDIKDAAIVGTRARLLETTSQAGMPARTTSQTSDMGTTNFVVAGEDQPTGYPEVDAVILGWKARLDVGSFA